MVSIILGRVTVFFSFKLLVGQLFLLVINDKK